jgi:hypothetical protein
LSEPLALKTAVDSKASSCPLRLRRRPGLRMLTMSPDVLRGVRVSWRRLETVVPSKPAA